MESSPITFGTDGWRAIIGADYTVANVRLLTQAVAQYWQSENPEEAARGFVVAYDTRFNAEMFAEAAAEVLAGNSIPVALTVAPTPTPVFAHAIVNRQAGGGITLTASHNPFDYQGYKVRSAYGGATSPEELAKIEKSSTRCIRETCALLPLLKPRKQDCASGSTPRLRTWRTSA